MDFPVALIFLMLSITAVDLTHANIRCTEPTQGNCNLNNVEVLEQLIDLRVRAALANIPGIAIKYHDNYNALLIVMLSDSTQFSLK
jgi:hypothetical protein